MGRHRHRPLLGLLVVAAGAAATAAGAAGNTMTVTASSLRPASSHVQLTVRLRYEMQCGYPGAPPVVLTLPGRVPATVVRSAVLVNGKPAQGVSVRGRQVTVTMRPRPQILCDSITTGTLSIELTARAGISNPAGAGSYRVAARKGALMFAAPLKITG